jgi:dipeptidyl aminopeptidase/acylaminoacyl peptidase
VYATNARRPEVVSRIVVRELDTGKEQELLRMVNLRLIGFLALSPDGSRLAFTAFHMAGGADGGAPVSVALTVMPASGGATTELLQVKFPELIGNLAWSPDLRSILFVRQNLGAQGTAQGSGAVWQIPAKGGASRELGAPPNQWARQRLNLRPDGRSIAYTRASKNFEVWVMENFLPMAKEAAPAPAQKIKK